MAQTVARMIGRRLPPVYSPLNLGALVAGWGAAVGLGNGRGVTRLEEALQQRFQATVAITTDSGTSALALAIAAGLRGRPKAPVALPAYCCYDVATAAIGADVPVLLYDVDPVTLGPDWPSFERAMSGGAGAAVVVHLFGMPVDMRRAATASDAAGACLIEDAAQGAGGRMRGRLLGSFGPLTVLSFGRGKGMTGGTGGALLARDAGVALVSDLRTRLGPPRGSGRALLGAGAQWLLGRPALYGVPASLPFLRLGETVFRPPHAPRSLGSGPAVVALDSLRRLEPEAAARAQRAEVLARAALDAGLPIPVPLLDSAPGYLRFAFLLERDASLEGGAALGIGRGYPRPLVDLPELAGRVLNATAALPGARLLAARLHTAPTHSRLTDRDLDLVVAWITASRQKALG